MSTANDAVLVALGQNAFPVNDCLGAPNANSQSTGTRCGSPVNRFTTSVSNGSAVLPSILSGEAEAMVFVINDSPNTIKVFCASGDSQNGSLNASLSIGTGTSGVFFKVGALHSKGGGGGGTTDWRSANIP
jgi:hypothetical protein